MNGFFVRDSRVEVVGVFLANVASRFALDAGFFLGLGCIETGGLGWALITGLRGSCNRLLR